MEPVQKSKSEELYESAEKVLDNLAKQEIQTREDTYKQLELRILLNLTKQIYEIKNYGIIAYDRA